MSGFPIITVCGSMRYYPLMIRTAEQYTANGYIVLMPFVTVGATEQSGDVKEMLDKMHFAKIDMADSILVVGEHRGESTLREIEYAKANGKKVYSVNA
jgi:hypothetical protein